VKVSDVWSGEFFFAPSRPLLTAFFLFFAILLVPTVALMILSLLFSVSLGRLTTVSRPRLGLTLSGNSTTYSSTANIAHTFPVCLCLMASRLYP